MRASYAAALVVLVVVIVGLAVYLAYPRREAEVVIGSISVGPSSFDAYRLDPSLSNVTGLKVDYVGYSLTPSLLDALLSNQVDVAILPSDLAAVALLQSNDTYVIAVDYNLFQAVIVPSGSNITSLAQLAGKRVAVPVGTGTYYLFVLFMKRLYNLTVSPNESGPDVVTAVNVAPSEVIDAVEDGSASAGVVWEPMVSEAMVQYHMRVLCWFSQLWENMTGEPTAPFLVWVATSKVVDNPHLLRSLLELHAESAAAWDSNSTLAEYALNKFYGVPVNVGYLVWEHTNNTPTGVCINQQELSELEEEWSALRQSGMISIVPPASRVITCASLGEQG